MGSSKSSQSKSSASSDGNSFLNSKWLPVALLFAGVAAVLVYSKCLCKKGDNILEEYAAVFEVSSPQN
jgi:hypothetical protein